MYTVHMDMSVPLWVQSPQHVSHHRWHRIHLTIAACSEYIAQPEPRILFPGPESSYHSNVYMYIYTMHINKLAVSVPMYAQLWPLDLLVPEVLIVLPLSPAVCNLVENYMRFGHRWIHMYNVHTYIAHLCNAHDTQAMWMCMHIPMYTYVNVE